MAMRTTQLCRLHESTLAWSPPAAPAGEWTLVRQRGSTFTSTVLACIPEGHLSLAPMVSHAQKTVQRGWRISLAMLWQLQHSQSQRLLCEFAGWAALTTLSSCGSGR